MKIKELTACAMLVFGAVLAFIALLIPPPGEIHDSVLYIFAQILIYAGSVFGISAYVDKIKGPPPRSPKGESLSTLVGQK